jgi:hypothetical protein
MVFWFVSSHTSRTDFLSDIYSDILSDFLFDILSGIASDIYSDILVYWYIPAFYVAICSWGEMRNALSLFPEKVSPCSASPPEKKACS